MMDREPFFSIVTVSYNSEHTIERTMRSILAQSCKDYEYIVVDGASSDGTMAIVKCYEPLFEGRLKWTSEPDGGIYNAMNKGIGRAVGRVIGIVNSDDWLEPDALQHVYRSVSEDVEGVLYCGSIYFHYQDGDKQLFRVNRQRFFEGIPHHSYNYGLYHPATFVGRRVYDEVGEFDEGFKIEADTDFIYRCYVAGKEFVFIDAVLSNMMDGGASNRVGLKKYYREKRYFVKKNNMTGVSAWLFLIGCMTKLIIKNNVPECIARWIRNKRR